jgi:hypothetical protein
VEVPGFPQDEGDSARVLRSAGGVVHGISGSHSGRYGEFYEECCLLRCYAVWLLAACVGC